MNTQKDSASLDDLLEMATQKTEEITEKALDCDEQGDFEGAAELYGQAAKVWQQVSGDVPEERRDFCLSLAQFWEDRANEARKQAAAKEGPPVREPRGAQLQDVTIRAQDLPLLKGFPQDKDDRTQFTPPPVRRGESPVKSGKTQFTHRPVGKSGSPVKDDKTSIEHPDDKD